MNYYENALKVNEEHRVILSNIHVQEIESYLEAIMKADKVFFIGVGRVMLALETMAKRLTHLGINTSVVGAINEPPIGPSDLLVVGSGSGESLIPKQIASCAKRYEAQVAHLTSNSQSSIAKMSDVVVNFHCGSKIGGGVFESIQPMSTLFEQSLMIFGDLVCLELMKRKGLSFEQVSKNHANLE